MKKQIRFFAFFLASIILLNSTITHATNIQSEAQVEEVYADEAYEEIMDAYYKQKYSMKVEALSIQSASQKTADLKEARDEALVSAGYEIYHLDFENIATIEDELNTDLSELNLNTEKNYLIAVAGDTTSTTSTSSQFTYTYNGTTYTMRTLIVTADDDEADSSFAQASDVDVLTSSVQNTIKNALNSAISACISSVSSSLGTIASICGLDISDFATNKSATLTLNAGTNWTRKYTQVYNSNDKTWIYGSSVEYVYCLSYMSGTYYEATTNKMTKVPTDTSTKTLYSSYYKNTTWQKQKAAIAYASSSVCTYDKTGSVKYKYGSTVKITHNENF